MRRLLLSLGCLLAFTCAVQAQQVIGGNGSGSPSVMIICDHTAFYDTNTNGSTQLVALSSGKTIYVCGFSFAQSTTTAVHVGLVQGTGSACGTSQTKITPAYSLQAATSTGPVGIAVGGSFGGSGLNSGSGNALCILTDAAVSVQALVWYTQF